jgi:hypothetical protein
MNLSDYYWQIITFALIAISIAVFLVYKADRLLDKPNKSKTKNP